MKSIKPIKAIKWSWVSAIIAVFLIAFVAGCNSADAEGDVATLQDPNSNIESEIYGGDVVGSVSDEDDEFCEFTNFEDFDMVVATINGIEITAGEMVDEFSWALNSLVAEYAALFPDDTEFNFDRPFRDDMTFGRAVREEAVNMAAHVKLYYDFATRHNLPWDMTGFQHPVIEVVSAIIEDPEMFAPFEPYMSEDTSGVYVQRAEDVLARALAGEDFVYLIETYGEDPGMNIYPDGYTFFAGDMVQSFEEATVALEIGEISGLVMSDFGIHIIKRVEPDPDNIIEGSSAPPDVSPDELLGAKHILIASSSPSLENRMFDAVFIVFEEKLETANIEFLPTLDNVPFPTV